MEDIPSKQLFCHLPEETREEGGLESGFEMDFPVRNDLINQKTHPESEEEGDEVFQDKLDDWTQIEKRTQTITLDEGDGRGKQQGREEKKPCQKDHEKINGFPPENPSPFLSLKDNVQGCPQGAEDPGGGPDQSSNAQNTNDLSILNDSQDVLHNPRV